LLHADDKEIIAELRKAGLQAGDALEIENEIAELRVNVGLLDDAIGQSGAIAALLVYGVEMARTLQDYVSRAKAKLPGAKGAKVHLEALKAWFEAGGHVKPAWDMTVNDLTHLVGLKAWVEADGQFKPPRGMTFKDIEFDIESVIYRAENALDRAGATRELGGAHPGARQDKQARKYAIGEIVFQVKYLLAAKGLKLSADCKQWVERCARSPSPRGRWAVF
jgi:hypothetical protein